MTYRRVTQVFPSVRQAEGGGFIVRRPFPTRTLDMLDPFLLLDEMGPADYGPGEAVGAPDHPHRGFETVTYLLEGSFQHKDSAGNKGTLLPGDVQWMTAGAGVVHSEMPTDAIMEKGGRLHGFQLWVNLPAQEKFIKPRYQDTPSSKIPVVEFEGGSVKVIAGSYGGAQAVIDTRTPIVYFHVRLKPGAKFEHGIGAGFNTFAYVVEGSGLFGRNAAKAGEGGLALFESQGEFVNMEAGEKGLNALLLGGIPLNEPVARYGPFVMNTPEQIMDAIRDYQAGRMGQITV